MYLFRNGKCGDKSMHLVDNSPNSSNGKRRPFWESDCFDKNRYLYPYGMIMHIKEKMQNRRGKQRHSK